MLYAKVMLVDFLQNKFRDKFVRIKISLPNSNNITF